MFKHHKTGFTLIELLIVITIIIFLAKLIAPRYSAFYAKARQTEVLINLTNLYAAEQMYHLEHGRYTENFAHLQWQPKGYTGNPNTTQNAYTYITSPQAQEGDSCCSGSSGKPATLSSGCYANQEGFLFKAGLKTGDTEEIWTLDKTGTIKQLGQI